MRADILYRAVDLPGTEVDSASFVDCSPKRLSALCKPGRPQTVKPVLVKRLLPGEELLLRKPVALAGFIQGKYSVPHGGYDRCFLPGNPASCFRGWKASLQRVLITVSRSLRGRRH